MDISTLDNSFILMGMNEYLDLVRVKLNHGVQLSQNV